MGIYTVKLPDIGEGVAEGEIIEWLKQPGDNISQDEPIVVVMTDKATVELPSPYPGTLQKQYYQVGDVAPVGQPLYDLDTEAAIPTLKKENEKAIKTAKSKVESSDVLALPKTRKKAREMGVDLGQVAPTGKHGEVTLWDLEHTGQDYELLPLQGVGKLMAKKMTESKSRIPHFSYFEQIDASRLVQLRMNVKAAAANEGISATYMPFFLRALSLTMNQYPLLNAKIDMESEKIVCYKRHNIGVAVSTSRGLIVPVLKDVHNMKIQDVIRAYDSLKKRARANQLDASDMKGATITISNYGVLGGGGRWATPIINYPESAILAVARIQKQPIIKNGELVIRDTVNLSWSFDHRLIDGDYGANASHFLAALIDNPAGLL